jgi:hypothetical protein
MSDQWTYIWMAYGATWVVLGVYYVYLRRRVRRAAAAAAASAGDERRMQ